jgi:hypothetical protein
METDGQDTGGAAQDIVATGELNSEQILERAILYALEQGAEKLTQGASLDPFTILIEGEELFIEDQPATSEEESYEAARRTIYQMERLCGAYVFCYDGYVDLDDGTSDALVVEYASRGDEVAQVIVRMYHRHGDHYHFDETLYQVGEADTLFGGQDAPGNAAEANAAKADAAKANAAKAPAAAEPSPVPAATSDVLLP